jgi:S1-C subfamily serine protease
MTKRQHLHFLGLILGLALPANVCAAPPVSIEVDPQVLAAESARAAVVKKASATTVAVFAGEAGGGSGVLISSDGFALTNFHVAQPAGVAMKCGLDDGVLYDAVLVGVDPTGDVALIKLLGRNDFPVAELADSDRVRVGDMAFTAGNPFLLATDYRPTIAFGMISGVHRYQEPAAGAFLEYADCIQTDAAINPGNSGGPLFDAEGRLIGINGRGSFEKRGRVNVGVGYAISINQIKNFLDQLHGGRVVDHATLGARVGSDADGRVVVTEVSESSDAYRRGLRYDDEIIRFAGRPVRTVNAFKNILGTLPKGWRVPLAYRRQGRTFETFVRLLSGVHTDAEMKQAMAQDVAPPAPDAPDKKPQPGDKPPGPEKKPDKPEKSRPPAHRKPPAQEMPEVVRKLYQARSGYANYHFNLVHQQRVWLGLRAMGDYHSRDPWRIQGKAAGGGDFLFRCSENDAELVLPTFQTRAPLKDDLSNITDPPQTGGLLVALSQWRRLLTRGIDDFGEVYYYGAAPLPGRSGLCDVLVGINGGVECRFYTDSSNGHLVAMELFTVDGRDPCEVYFEDYKEQNGRWWPRRLTVRHGDQEYGRYQIAPLALEKEGQP